MTTLLNQPDRTCVGAFTLAVRAPLTSAAVWAAMGPLPTYGAMDGGAESVHAIVRGASAVLTACTYIWQATGITSPHI